MKPIIFILIVAAVVVITLSMGGCASIAKGYQDGYHKQQQKQYNYTPKKKRWWL